jgi:hypothetical protein
MITPAPIASARTPTAATSVAGVPQDMLHFGVANQPSDLGWMTGSGVPWRYRYQYLAGGVNTGTGWETWNSPAGQFATYYMNASSANGYIPVFSYYELLQSTPSTGSSESDRDFSNLNSTATMAAYYANFKLLMQKAGTFNNTVVIHVEPDLWGYLEQRAAGGTASTVSASVASSGFAEAAGLPNTVQGFAFALLKLRDTYAPKAVLALHASPWGSGVDISSDRRSSVSATGEADVTAAFLNSAGVASNPYGSTWDLVFNDIDDHDAGWWEQHGADDASFTHWWDPSNATYPNFNRYLAWVGELHAKTGRPQVVWQVPVGNQWFLTMNNTCGHYQDNVGSYFISHSSSLYSAGLIAVLFGSGNACQTTNTDGQNDGITNNNGAPTTDVAGYCNACNTHTSTSSDDDGGYLRIFVGQYYTLQSWHSLGGALTSGPDAAASGSETDVFVRGNDGGVWQSSWNGSWSTWRSVGGSITSDPAAVSRATGRIDLFARGADNGLWQRSWNGTSWGAWQSLGGLLTSGPDVSSSGVNSLDVFVRGADNGLWQRSWNGTYWGAWRSLGGALTSDPGAVSWGPGRIDVFVRGVDNGLWQRSWNGSGWSPWQSLGGVLTSGPDAASCSQGHLDVFALGPDGGIWRRGWSAGWSGWLPMGGSWTSSPSAVCRPTTTTVDLFVRGTDSGLWTMSIIGS